MGGSASGGGRSLPSRHLDNWIDIGVDESDATYMRLNACDIQDFAYENL